VATSEIALFGAGRHAATGANGFVSVRHNPGELDRFWPSRKDAEFLGHTGWVDVLAHGGISFAGGQLSTTLFQSHDALPFNTAFRPFTVNTGFEWMSGAGGGSWTGALKGSDNTVLTLRAWRSNTDIRGAWSVRESDLTLLTNSLRQTGGSIDVHTTGTHVEAYSGLTLERFQTEFVVTPYLASQQGIISSDPRNRFTLAGSLSTTSVYTDIQWRLSEHLTLLPGTRLTYRNQANHNGWQLEPRGGISFTPSSRLQFAAYYSRTAQRLQSLRNEENVFDGIVGLNFLSVQNVYVPMATSTAFSGTMNALLSSGITLDMGAYSRRMQNIVVAPRTGNAPFISDSIASGSGSAQGWYASLVRTTPRLTVDGSLRLMRTRFWGPNVDYQPGFASTRFASLSLGWTPVGRTNLHTLIVASGGRHVAGTLTRFVGDLRGLGAPGVTQGSGETLAPGSQNLPPYLIANVGISQALRLGNAGARDGNGTRIFAAIDNVFNRTNVIAKEIHIAVTDQALIPYHPRTYTAGLECRW